MDPKMFASLEGPERLDDRISRAKLAAPGPFLNTWTADEKEKRTQAQDRARMLWLGEKVAPEARFAKIKEDAFIKYDSLNTKCNLINFINLINLTNLIILN